MVASRTVTIALAVLAGAALPASAQTTYVSASLFGDVVRSNHSTAVEGAPASGEALGFALRVGTPLGASWGVEAEFARPGAVGSDVRSGPLPLVPQPFLTLPVDLSISPVPPIVYEVRTSARYTTLSASLWYQQLLTARVSLAYLGGIAFSRTVREYELHYAGFARLGIPSGPASFETASIEYGVRPLAGFEARISLTDHVQIVPGVRMHASTGVWLIRPSVGIGWAN